MIRPALLINDLQKGGAERLVVDLAIEISERESIDPVVIVGDNVGELRSELAKTSVPLYSLEVDITPAGAPAGAWKLSKLINKLEVDLVHSHLAFSHLISRIACIGTEADHVTTYHNIRGHKQFYKRIAERVTEPLSDQSVCVSEGVRETFAHNDGMEVIYNAIDVDRFDNKVKSTELPHESKRISEDTFVLLNIARCVEQKRQIDLVRMMEYLTDENVHLFIVGDGPCRKLIEDTVHERGLGDYVTVTGYVDAIEPYYALADIFVSSSENEGLPTTHIEASACGLPIVSTNIPGVTEVVDNDRTGCLSPVGNPCEMASTIKNIRGKNQKQMGQEGQKKVKKEFSLSCIASEHIEIYQDIVNDTN